MATDRPPPKAAWYWKLETPEWEARIRGLARRMFHSEPDILDIAVEHARREVLAKARAGKIPVRNDPYMLTLLKYALIDFSKRRYGYRRPPVWVQRLGRIWEAVYRLPCVLKIAPEEIGPELVERRLRRRAETQAAEGVAAEAIVAEAIREILRKERDCLRTKALPTLSLDAPPQDGEDDMTRDLAQPNGAVETVLDREAIERVLEVLRTILAGKEPDPSAGGRASDRAIADLEKFAGHLTLTDRERLVLGLVYQEGLSARAAARALNDHERTVQRLRRQAEKKIAATFARAGIDDPFALLGTL